MYNYFKCIYTFDKIWERFFDKNLFDLDIIKITSSMEYHSLLIFHIKINCLIKKFLKYLKHFMRSVL